MEKWLSELLDKIKENKELASNGKHYTRCPCCGEIDIQPEESCETDFLFGTGKDEVRPAIMFGAYVYIPIIDSYGEFCWCQKCLAHFYAIHIKSTNDFKIIMCSPPIEEIRNYNCRKLNPLVKDDNVYLCKAVSKNTRMFINKKLNKIITHKKYFWRNGKLMPLNEMKEIYDDYNEYKYRCD